MNEDENGCGCNCNHRGMHQRMHGYRETPMQGMGGMQHGGIGYDNENLGPLHKERLVEKLKLYKEDLEEQVKFIAKRIDELEGKSETEKK